MTLGALDGIRAWCREREVAMVLLVIPRSLQVYGWELEQWLDVIEVTEHQLDLDRPQRVLRDWATANQVAFLDLLPRFRSHGASGAGARLYFYPNAHLNVVGHRLAGQILAEFQRDQLSLDPDE